VLTVDEAATLLRVSADDVLSLVESGELRARRIGEHWRLTRTALMDWLRGDATTA
jgi:excisionase family DNA binding protein